MVRTSSPVWHTVQNEVFEKSFTGPYVKKYLAVLLIKPTTTSDSTTVQNDVPAN